MVKIAIQNAPAIVSVTADNLSYMGQLISINKSNACFALVTIGGRKVDLRLSQQF